MPILPVDQSFNLTVDLNSLSIFRYIYLTGCIVKTCLWMEYLWISLLGIWFLQAPLCSFMGSPLFYYFCCICKLIDFMHQFCVQRELRISCWAAPALVLAWGWPSRRSVAQTAGKISYTLKENAQQHHWQSFYFKGPTTWHWDVLNFDCMGLHPLVWSLGPFLWIKIWIDCNIRSCPSQL